MTAAVSQKDEGPRIVGRYAIHGAIASGGMATVHLGRLLGPVGFSRTVAIKRLHPQFAQDPEFLSMFLDEARLAGRIRHPNVVPTLDVVATHGELFLVMDYVHGESLARLLRAACDQRQRIPLPIISSIMSGVLHGLHAAHEAKSERGEPLSIVHRDVSPQNVLVGADGVARVLDFGVAKATGRMRETRDGNIKGKIAYMAPEQLLGDDATRLADIYAAGVVLWELLTGTRLFSAKSEGALVAKVLAARIEPPSQVNSTAYDCARSPACVEQLRSLDPIVLRALHTDSAHRFPTARDMALAIEKCVSPAPASELGAWVESVAGQRLDRCVELVAEVENAPAQTFAPDALMTSLRESHISEISAREHEVGETDVDLSRLSHASLRATATTIEGTRSRSHARVTLIGLAVVLVAVATLSIGKSRTRTALSAESAPTITAGATRPESMPLDETARVPVVDQALASSAPRRSSGSPTTKPTARGSVPSRRQLAPSAMSDCWTVDDAGIKRFNTRDSKCMQ